MNLTKSDLIADARDTDLPLLVYAHPASGTQWMADQLAHVLDGPVAHENLHGKPVSHYKAVVTFKNAHHKHYRQKFGHVVAMVRDPVKVVASALDLYERGPMRGMVLASFYGDGLPYGYNWAAMQQHPWSRTPIATLLRWWELVDTFDPPIYRVEDAVQVTDKTRTGSKARGLTVSWDELLTVNGRGALPLLQKAEELGYSTTRSIGGV